MHASSAEHERQVTITPQAQDKGAVWDLFVESYHVGDVVSGTVVRIKSYGAFVEFGSGQNGLVHRSQIVPGETIEVEDKLWVGDRVKAVIKEIDRPRKRVRLSIADYLRQERAVLARQGSPTGTRPPRDNPAGSRNAPALDQELTLYEDEIQGTYQELEDLVQAPGVFRRILLIEDQDDVRSSLATWLRACGYDVTIRDDFATTLKTAPFALYDLVLLDAHTPTVSSVDTVHGISENHSGANLVLMTGNPLNSVDQRRLARQANVRVIRKPFSMVELRQVIQSLEQGKGVEHSQEPEVRQVAAQATSSLLPTGSRESLRQATSKLLRELMTNTDASAAAVFEMDLVTRQVTLLASRGIHEADFEAHRRDLDISPVKDVIIDGEVIHETNVLGKPRKYRYLLPLLMFESCIGIPLAAAGSRRYGLFVFGSDSQEFSDPHRRLIDIIASTLNALIERHALERALHIAHDFSILGQVSAGLAHEVNNRIAALVAQVRLLQHSSHTIGKAIEDREHPSQELLTQLRNRVQTMTRSIERLRQTAHLFQQLTSPREGHITQLPVAIQHAIEALQTTAHRKRVAVEVKPLPQLPIVDINDIALEHVLLNLILNAIQHIPGHRRTGGKVTVSVRLALNNEQLPVEIRVTDNGPGIHRQWWERVFDLGFSTRANGSGLGLFVARSFVESYGGKLYIEDSTIMVGSTFLIALPVAARSG